MTTVPAAAPARAAILDQAAYWLTVAGVYLLVGYLFVHSGKEKLFDDDGHMPPPLKEQFDGTVFATFPGTDALWIIVGVLELGIALLLLASLVRLEFLPDRTKSLLLTGLALAFFTYACLSFGQTTTGNTQGTASLYSYFASTVIIFLLVRALPPNAPPNWVTGRFQSRL